MAALKAPTPVLITCCFLLISGIAFTACSGSRNDAGSEASVVSRDLLEIQKSYAAHLKSAAPETFQVPGKPVIVSLGRIAIDAVAKDDAAALLLELQALGLEKGAVSGRKVSGLLPIDAVDQLNGLAHLKFVRPVYVRTRSR